MKLIVGLGNPGGKYELTRHNIGFEIVDLFRREIGASKPVERELSLVAEGRLGTEELILANPQTSMNCSGEAVAALVSKHDVTMEDLIIIYDDLNLDLGLLRIRRKGSSGGHNGVKSVIESVGYSSFSRLRVGIGRPPEDMKFIDYVLSRFSDEEREIIEETKKSALEALRIMIVDGLDAAMSEFNSRGKSEEESGDR